MHYKKIIFLLCTSLISNLNSRTVKNIIRTRDALVENQLTAGSVLIHHNLNVEGSVNFDISKSSSVGNVKGPTSSTDNAVARFDGTSGKRIKNSGVLVDDSNNIANVNDIELSGITKDGETAAWPSVICASGTFLGSDGAGNLVFSTPSGGGNVSTDSFFTVDNAILRVDLPSGVRSIQQSGITIDDSDNITGVATLNLTNAADNSVGIKASTSVTDYTLTLPGTAPSASQLLQAGSSTATDLEWVSMASFVTPTTTRTIYVSKAGNDSTGDGSFEKPYLTVTKGVDTANSLSSSSSPVVVSVGAGIFTEDNSGSPIIISSQGISIVGESIIGTIIVPNTLSNDLFSLSVPGIEFATMTLDAGVSGSSASGIHFNSNTAGTAKLQSITMYRFLTGVEIESSGTPIIIMDNFQARGNTTAISVSSARLLLKDSVFLGPFTGSTITNTCITITGSPSLVTMLSCSFRLMTTAISNNGDANLRVLGTAIESTTNGLSASGASITQMVGCDFTVNNSSSVNVLSTGSGTEVTVEACFINGRDASGIAQGIGVKLVSEGYVEILSSHLDFLTSAAICGQTGDTSSTSMVLSNSFLHENTADITQVGSSSLQVMATSCTNSKISINDSANVKLVYFDLSDQSSLTLGNQSNVEQDLIQVDNGFSTLPRFKYFPNFYGHDSLIY